MKRYAIIDKTNGNVDFTMGWGDDRDLPENYPMELNQEVITITDDNIKVDGSSYCYNSNTKEFEKKLTVTTDNTKIVHIDGVANITIIYSDTTINEVCHMELDGQTVDIDIINGKATVPFSSEILGWHNFIFTSSSHYGKNYLSVEVV